MQERITRQTDSVATTTRTYEWSVPEAIQLLLKNGVIFPGGCSAKLRLEKGSGNGDDGEGYDVFGNRTEDRVVLEVTSTESVPTKTEQLPPEFNAPMTPVKPIWPAGTELCPACKKPLAVHKPIARSCPCGWRGKKKDTIACWGGALKEGRTPCPSS